MKKKVEDVTTQPTVHKLGNMSCIVGTPCILLSCSWALTTQNEFTALQLSLMSEGKKSACNSSSCKVQVSQAQTTNATIELFRPGTQPYIFALCIKSVNIIITANIFDFGTSTDRKAVSQVIDENVKTNTEQTA
ncbi:hypothetical protein SCA6_000887 [Theobroma cacao]